jgi:hypothetical protein
MQADGQPQPRDEFFVAYLPTPPRTARALRQITIALCTLGLATAALLAGMQSDSGDGKWAVDEPGVFTGLLVADPYLLLHGAGDEPQTALLTGVGKRRPDDKMMALAGQVVRARGTRIERGGQLLIEVASAEPGGQRSPSPPMQIETARTTLRGEIIDPKCYLGAMKPGDGKTHKACAALCLRGGIPPMLAVRGGDGVVCLYLLCNSQGGRVEGQQLEWIADRAAETVELKGRAGMLGSLRILAIEENSFVPDGIQP